MSCPFQRGSGYLCGRAAVRIRRSSRLVRPSGRLWVAAEPGLHPHPPPHHQILDVFFLGSPLQPAAAAAAVDRQRRVGDSRSLPDVRSSDTQFQTHGTGTLLPVMQLQRRSRGLAETCSLHGKPDTYSNILPFMIHILAIVSLPCEEDCALHTFLCESCFSL